MAIAASPISLSLLPITSFSSTRSRAYLNTRLRQGLGPNISSKPVRVVASMPAKISVGELSEADLKDKNVCLNVAFDDSGEITRKSAYFHPSIWGDKFLEYSTAEVKTDEEVQLQLLKEQVKKMLVASDTPQQELLSLVDNIQRLGLAYHFEPELETLLQHIKDSFREFYGTRTDNDLHDVALCFRLLRQQGHFVSSVVVKKLVVKAMQKKLAVKIMQVAVKIMQVAVKQLAFKEIRVTKKVDVKEMVPKFAVKKRQIDVKQVDVKEIRVAQKVDVKEMAAKWWKDLDVANKLPFARDRVVECYFWILGIYFNPRYTKARTFVTKVISLASIVDDMYDVFATGEELEQFSDAIKKWDISSLDTLPEYMRHCYQPLLDVFAEAEEELVKEGGPKYGLDHAKDRFKRLAGSYHQEADWCRVSYFPTFEEYMSHKLGANGLKMVSITSFVLMGNVATREAFEWITKDPLILRALSVIGRLGNDIAGHEKESRRPHIPSAVECFMQQYAVSKDTTYDALQKHITNAWKDMNKELLRPTTIPMPLLEKVFNFTCATNLLYEDGQDGYTVASTTTKDRITSILIDPIPI